jgi:ABC-type Fe3+/spermidine/putrescine transport system ATPase subunit
MTGLELDNICVWLNGQQILYDVSMSIKKGECVALLGPSGCGKTTTLRTIAGFIHPQSGDVRVAGQSCIGLAPNKRNMGLVFQDYALFPHMTVAQNVAYGLRMRNQSGPESDKLVKQFLEMVQLDHVGDRLPENLSGGQKQRVALARALVIKPDILLLDEPLGALDRKLRDQMQVELKQLQKQLGVTTIIVTHDQEEALSLADRVAVMFSGAIWEIGSPQALYDMPRHRDVMDFLGGSNLFNCCVTDVDDENATLSGPGGFQTVLKRGDLTLNEDVLVGIRPEHLSISIPNEADADKAPTVRGLVHETVYKGTLMEILIKTHDDHLFRASVSPRSISQAQITSGNPISLVLEKDYIRVFKS